MPDYTLGHDESVLRSHRWRTVENSAAFLLPHLRQGMRLLDVGCGPGTVTAGFASIVGVEGDVLGVDSSPEVIEVARTSAANMATDNLEFAVQDVMNLDLPDASFDVVYAHQVLQHLTEPVSALREMQRVTKPGGIIAVRESDYEAMTWFPLIEGLDRWLSIYRETTRLHGTEPDAGRRLLSWAHEAGLNDVVASASVWCFATAEDRQWWGGLQADRIVTSDIAKLAVDGDVATHAELEQISAAWRAWSQADDAWFAVLHGEIICRVG